VTPLPLFRTMCLLFVGILSLIYRTQLVAVTMEHRRTRVWIVLCQFNCALLDGTNNQHYAQICTTALYYMLAPTCFGSSLPSSGSFLDPSELLDIQIGWAVYLKYITDKRISICYIFEIYRLFDLYFK
jgi:hypothetical protein